LFLFLLIVVLARCRGLIVMHMEEDAKCQQGHSSAHAENDTTNADGSVNLT
jgi:hypothetical protein